MDDTRLEFYQDAPISYQTFDEVPNRDTRHMGFNRGDTRVPISDVVSDNTLEGHVEGSSGDVSGSADTMGDRDEILYRPSVVRFVTTDSPLKKKITCVLGVILFVYNLSAVIYECIIAIDAIKISIRYNGYRLESGIYIDDLPKGLYQNTVNTAWVLSFISIIGFIFIISVILDRIYMLRSTHFMTGIVITNIVVSLVPFYFTAFDVAKLDNLTMSDKQIWNAIDSGFIDIMHMCDTLLYIVIIPGLYWSFVALVMFIILIVCEVVGRGIICIREKCCRC